MAREHPITDQARLETCEQEPIQAPGLIQPHGILIGADLSGRVVAVSRSVEELATVPAESLLGQSVFDLIEPIKEGSLRVSQDEEAPIDLQPVDVRIAGRPFTVHSHLSTNGLRVFELEPPTDSSTYVTALLGAQRLIENLQTDTELEALLFATARAARQITGFDRAMIYRFHGDGHGEVVAENRAEEVESFMGLNYPATDIPERARRLYVRNRVRSIANVGAPGSALLLTDDAPQPLDLSHAWLRAVSPIHLQYLKNMGVGASASVSILRRGELWGLVALHNLRPRVVSLDVRLALDLLGRMISTKVDLRLTAFEQSKLQLAHRQIRRLLESGGETGGMASALQEHAARLLHLIDGADGVAAVLGLDVVVSGRTPSPAAVSALARGLHQARPGQSVQTDHLAGLEPGLDGQAEVAAGMLAVPLASDRPDYLMWFKPEARRSVRWAGRPDEAVKRIASDDRESRLQPRASFDVFVESVAGKSLEFATWETMVAEVVGTAIGHAIRQVDEVVEVQQELSLAEERFDLLVQHSPFAMVLIHRRSNAIVLSNPAFDEYFEVAVLRGTPLHELLPMATPQELERLATSPTLSVWTIHPSGERTRMVEPTVVPLALEGEGMLLVTFRDNTERIVAEEALRESNLELERSNRELNAFVYVASHDLKAPLRGIRNLADWIEEDSGADLPDAARKHLRTLQSRVDRMDRLFQDLLEYSRASLVKESYSPVDVEERVRVCFDLVGGFEGFQLEVMAPPVAISLRQAEFESILRNLISNSIKHHDRPNGTIRVDARIDGDMLHLDVEDDGPGIPANCAEQVFELFTTLRPRDQVEGSGMGLAMVRRLAERSEGRVFVVPREDRGAHLHVELKHGGFHSSSTREHVV